MANINGTNNKDILHGTAGVDQIYGQGGDDIIYGYGGNDTIGGGAGNDILYGGDGNDTIYGGAGDDKIIGGAGADIIYGGDGIDTVSYEDYVPDDENPWSGVEVYLDNSYDTGDWSGSNDSYGDKFFKVENVIGSQYGDKIYGDSGDNIIWGNGGNDQLYGYSYGEYGQPQDIADLFAGNDIFYTGSRAGEWSSVCLGLGSNTVYGGDGDEHIERVGLFLDDYIAYGQSLGIVTLHLGEGNNYTRFDAIGEYEITAGSGDDEIGFSGPGFDTNQDISYLTGKITVDGGDGNNNIWFGYNTIAVDITAGDGNDRIDVQRGWSHYRSDLDVPFGEIRIDAGDGDNYIGSDDVNYNAVNIVSGNGKDEIGISEHINVINSDDNHYYSLPKEYYAEERILDSGAGDDRIEMWGVNYFDIKSGSENDEIMASGSHLTIDAGTGDDIVSVGFTLNSSIDLGAGNDEIVIESSNQNIVIKGDAGDDIYHIGKWGSSSSYEITIDNYDKDGGRDILKASTTIDKLSAHWQDDDLIINQHGYGEEITGIATLQDFALGSDYQIDEFQIGNSYSGYESYSAEQFLAEMGLSL